MIEAAARNEGEVFPRAARLGSDDVAAPPTRRYAVGGAAESGPPIASRKARSTLAREGS